MIYFFLAAFFWSGLRAYSPGKSIPTDTWTHLYFIKLFNRGAATLSKGVPLEAMGSTSYTHYPALFHKIMGWLPFNKVARWQSYVGAFVECVFIALWWGLIAYYKNQSAAFLAVTLYLATPATFTVLSRGPRNRGLTPRNFSECITNTLYLCIWLIHSTSEQTEGAAALVCLVGACVWTTILSSKFGVQLLLLVVLPAVVLMADYYSIIAGFLSLLVAGWATKGGVWRSLAEQRHHLGILWKKSRNGNLSLYKRWRFPLAAHSSSGRCAKALKASLIDYIPSVLLFKYPVVFCTAIAALLAIDDIGTTVLVSVPIAAMVFTSLPSFLFLGESERYLNGTLILYPAVFVSGLDYNVNSYFILILYGSIFGLLDLVARIRVGLDDKVCGSDVDDFIRTLPEGSTVLCSNLFLLDGCRALIPGQIKWIYPGFWPKGKQEEFRQFESIYPRLNYGAVAGAARAYNADVVLLEGEDSQHISLASNLLSSAGWDLSRDATINNVLVYVFMRRS